MPHFKKGQSGNPNGRPAGIVDKRKALTSLLEKQGEPLVNKAIELALTGDSQALRLLIERLIPRAKQDAISISLTDADLNKISMVTELGQKIIQAVCEGKLTPEEGKTMGSILEAQRKLIETNELDERVEALEYALKTRKKESKK